MEYLYWIFILCVLSIFVHSRGSPTKMVHSVRLLSQVIFTFYSIARTILIMMWIKFKTSKFAKSLRSRYRSIIFRSPCMTDESHTNKNNVARKPLRRPKPLLSSKVN